MTRLLELPLRAPRSALAVMVALTLAFGVFAQSFKLDGSIESLLPPADHPDRQYSDAAKAAFGDEAIAVIGLFADDIFTPPALAAIDQLSQELARIEGVKDVISLTTVKGIEVNDFGMTTGRLMRQLPRTQEEAAAFRARVMANPIYVKNIVSTDGRAAGVNVVFEALSDTDFVEKGLDKEAWFYRVEDQIRALMANLRSPEQRATSGIRDVAMTGIPTVKVNAARLMENDFYTFTPLSLLLVIAVLALAFRTVRGVLVPLSTVIIGTVWTTGLMVVTGTAINLGTLVLNPLLMVIGIASGIHLISQYYLELKPGRSPAEVVRHALDHVSVPIAIASTTTLIGFGSLVFTPIRAVREFGEYSVFGILAILLAAFTVVPAALVLLPLPKKIRGASESEGSDWLPRFLQHLGSFSVRHRRTVLMLGFLLVGLSFWGISRIQVETNYLRFFSPDSFIRREHEQISRQLAGTQPVYIVVDGDAPQSVSRLPVLAAMHDLQQFIDRQPGVDKTMSLIDYLGIARRALQPDATGAIPQTQSEVDQILLLVDPVDVRPVLNSDGSRANLIVRTSLSGSGEVSALVDCISDYAAGRVDACGQEAATPHPRFPRGITVRPTGTLVLLSQSSDELAWGQVTGLWQELTVLLALLSFMFLSVRVGGLALIPNVLPTVILYGIMGWVGINLNISTSTIAAIAIGIAIDDTIHLLSAFNEGMRRTGSQEQAIVDAMGSAGQAAFFIALALSAGFFIVCLSNFQPVQHFGLLSGLTMGIALVVELFLTPALVTTTKIITLWDLLFLKLGPEPEKQIPLFAGLSPFQAKLVVLMGHLESVGRGVHIARRGELKEELYVLLNGRAEVHRADSTQGDRVIRSMSRGDVVGEMGLVRHRPRSADVVAAEDLEYLTLDGRFLQRLQRRYPRVAAKVFLNLTRILSDRLESTTDALAASAQATPGSDPGAPRAPGSGR
jgi:predicted RND superfamily exporter protein